MRHAGLITVAILLLFTRRPDAFLNPQFWAEDGTLWYPVAYSLGFATLFGAEGGYLQTLPRLLGLLSLPLPLAWAPALFTATAILARLIPVLLLLSSRLSALVPNRWHRAGLALLYIALPNSYEIHANMTQAVRHLAVASILVILAPAEKRLAWRVFDAVLLLLTGLSGPFTILAVPVLVVLHLKRRPVDLLHAVAIAGTAIAQLAASLAWWNMRPTASLGASLEALVRIVGGQVAIGSVLGQHGWARIHPTEYSTAWCVVATAACAGVLILALQRGSLEFRLFTLYMLLIFAASLARPIEHPMGAWVAMDGPASGSRSWFFPMMAVLLALVVVARHRRTRWIALPFLAMLPYGIVHDWRYAPHPNLHFAAHARRWDAASPGETILIPINPGGWTLTLVKHDDRR